MTWNYRVIERNGYLQIHEVYYDEGGVSKHLWTEDPVIIGGETLEELQQAYEWFGLAISRSILVEDGDTLREKND